MSYDMIDRFLRNNLDDDNYAEYLIALEEIAFLPQREWVGLTEQERNEIYDNCSHYSGLKAIEAKLKEKNT